MFECPSDLKVIIISEDISLEALRIFFYANRSCTILLDGCVVYESTKLKCDNDVGKIFFIYSEFSSKFLFELNVTFGPSPLEILSLSCCVNQELLMKSLL